MYVPHTEEERKRMLTVIGAESVDELYRDVPEGLPQTDVEMPEGAGEMEVQRLVTAYAKQNNPASDYRCFLGAGAYQHYIPATVPSVVSRGEFLTAYTPYQAEASQGTLVAIYEFQSMVAELFGMELANASMYDGASAFAEGVIAAARTNRRGKVLVSDTVHPAYRNVMRTYLARQQLEVIAVPMKDGKTDLDALSSLCDDDLATVAFQHPNVFGLLEPAERLCEIAHEAGGMAVTCGHPLAYGVLRPPGAFGADVASAEGQPLGLPLAYGGPYVGLLAAKKKLMRKLPGRLVGKTQDSEGNPGYVLTLQTREQHIRREKATSNICSNQAACALACTVYMSMLGPQGMREAATRNVQNRDLLMQRIQATDAFKKGRVSFAFEGAGFNEFVLRLEADPDDVLGQMRQAGVLGGLPLKDWYPELDQHVLVCSTEVHTGDDHEAYVNALEASL